MLFPIILLTNNDRSGYEWGSTAGKFVKLQIKYLHVSWSMFGQEPSQMIAGCLGGGNHVLCKLDRYLHSCCTYNSPQNFMSWPQAVCIQTSSILLQLFRKHWISILSSFVILDKLKLFWDISSSTNMSFCFMNIGWNIWFMPAM